MKRFIVMTDNVTPRQTQLITDTLHLGFRGWWHWLPNAWLVTATDTDAATPQTLSDAITGAVPELRHLVFELKGEHDWAGFGPTDPVKGMFEWLYSQWATKS